MVDILATEKFAHWHFDFCPTLTRCRAQAGGFYVLQRGSFLTLREMASLMAIPKSYVDKLLRTGVEESLIAGAFGNGQSVNVLERILGEKSGAQSIASYLAALTISS